MTVLCLDTETTTWNNGSPYDSRNWCVCYSWADDSGSGAELISDNSLKELQDRIDKATIITGFNFKFDTHWFWKLGIKFPEECSIFDTQSGEFILTNQQLRYPSLEDALVKYSLGHKIDIIKNEYWLKGINTDQIPWEVLKPYAEQDAVMSLKLYHHMLSIMSPEKRRLWRLMGMDQLILTTMEKNGIKFNQELCNERAAKLEEEIKELTDQLSTIYPNVPINFGSGDQLSAFLYGGTIVEEGKEHVGFFKTGPRAGEPKYKNIEILHELPRLVEPLRGSELKKPGFYATGADVLLKLKPNKKTKTILSLIQRQVRLESLLSKTYRGLVKSNIEGYWPTGWLHGQFNQCVAGTGRLSSSNPNLQNLDGQAQDIFVSRYND